MVLKEERQGLEKRFFDLGIVFSIFSWAKIGPPAATSPITGISSFSDSLKTIPREAPESIFINPSYYMIQTCIDDNKYNKIFTSDRDASI